MKLKKGLMLIIAASVIIAACKDKEETPKSKKEMLTSGSWIGTDLLIDGQSIWSVLVGPCSQDDFYTYKADGALVTDEGATKCDPADPQTSSDTWSLSADETKLTIGGEESTIIELTETSLIVQTKDSATVFEGRFKKK